MVSMVNGYVCRSGCDEAVARKGRDPRNPTGDPVKAEQLAMRHGKAVELKIRTVAFDQDASTVQTGLDAGRRSLSAPLSGDARILDVTA